MYRSFNVKNKTIELPVVQNFNKLSLNDLLKIKRAYDAYLEKTKKIDEENKMIDLVNNRTKRENEIEEQKLKIYEKQYEEPALEAIWQIAENLKHFHIGLISRLLFETVQYDGEIFKKTPQSERLMAQHKLAIEKHNNICANRPSGNWQRLEHKLRQPKDYTILEISGLKSKIYHGYKLNELNELINSRRSGEEKREEAIHELKARAANNELKTRQLAQPIRRQLNNQLSILAFCPYCAGPLSPDDAHLDHIHPVSKGGLSASKNLVFVCSSCNQQKRDLSLRHFIEKKQFDAAEIHKRLDLLGKD